MLARPIPVAVPVDGTPGSESILLHLKAALRQGRLDPLLFRVAPVDDDDAAAEAKAYLEELRKRLKRSDRLAVATALGLGRAAPEILLFAKARQLELIAMATRGRGMVASGLLGSTAKEVVASSPVPVLLCRPGGHPKPWDKVVVALDGTPESEEILPAARRLMEPGGVLHLVRVDGREDPMPYLTAWRERLVEEGVKAMPVAREGRPGEQLVRFAEESGAGLVALRTRNRQGVSRLLAGSVAEHVIRHAPCPVLVLSPS